MTGLRARVRAELTAEIKAAARRQLAAEGANLSLRAIARELGMASSALYRYFASRDELLTALIIEAYEAMGEAAERAEAAIDRDDFGGRFAACCHAVRDWSLAHPHEYALLYGSPVPGYAAPEDTIGPARRPVAVLGSVLRDAVAAGVIEAAPPPDPPELAADLARVVADPHFAGIGEAALLRGFHAWVQLYGAISFELFGRLDNVVSATDAFFAGQVAVMTCYVLGERPAGAAAKRGRGGRTPGRGGENLTPGGHRSGAGTG